MISTVESVTYTLKGKTRCLVRLQADDGLSGIGETAEMSEPQVRSLEAIRPMLLGRDPFDIEAFLLDVRQRSLNPGAPDRAVVAAAEAAMRDLAGRMLGVPTFQLMGGRHHDTTRCCFSGWSHDHKSSESLIREISEFDASASAVLIEPFMLAEGNVTTSEALDTVVAVSKALPDDIDIALSVRGAAHPRLVIDFASELGSELALWLEMDAVPSELTVLEEIRETTAVPIAAGRGLPSEDHVVLATEGLADYLIADPAILGGTLETIRVAATAEIAHVMMVLVASQGPISLSSTLQVAGAIPNLGMVEVPYEIFADSKAVGFIPPLKAGSLDLLSVPGNGIDQYELSKMEETK